MSSSNIPKESAPRGNLQRLKALMSSIPAAVTEAMPDVPRPQLASLVDVAPEGEQWLYEIKYDGYRVLARLENGRVSLLTRNGKDWSHRFPEIAASLARLPANQAILDGEIVAQNDNGITSFQCLQEALTAAKTEELVYYVFDFLYWQEFSLLAVTQQKRKEVLRLFFKNIKDRRLRYAEHFHGQGQAFRRHACDLGFEGVLAKNAAAPYRSGRSSDWLKIKCSHHEEFVVGGFTQPRGQRRGFGALLLGVWRNDELVYSGKVGTGFSHQQLVELHRELSKLKSDKSPFANPDNKVYGSFPRSETIIWVEPEMVVEVEYTEETRDRLLRHPRFRGIREDKLAKEIVVAGSSSEKNIPKKSTRDLKGNVDMVAGIKITHPDRVLYPQQGITKRELAQYYENIADWILPWVRRRPLTLVRCPEGREKQCFYQKHPYKSLADVPRIVIAEKSGQADYLYIDNISHVVALVQWGTLELHAWGCRIDDIERPDLMVFDLDPSPEVSWKSMIDIARALRKRIDNLGLTSFLRLTGGKGLHLVIPLIPHANWEQVKDFSQAVAEQHAASAPELLTTNMSKAKRKGKVFIDYLRNGRGSTAILNYSARARPGAPVALPVKWRELNSDLVSDKYRVDTLTRRLAALRGDPWNDFESSRAMLTPDMFESVDLGGSVLKRRP